MDSPRENEAALKAVGSNLRRARASRDITLEVLAERANLNIRTLQKFEAGQSNMLVTTLLRLRQGIGCPWEEILGSVRAKKQPKDGQPSE